MFGAGIFGTTFNLLGTLKDRSLKINSLPLNIIVLGTEMSWKMASIFVRNVCFFFKLVIFFSKSSIFVHFGTYDLLQISSACSPTS